MREDDTLDRLRRSRAGASQIEPLDDHVVVDPSDGEHETAGGLIIPAASEVGVLSGVVLSAGDEVTDLTPGDKVIFPAVAAIEVRLAGERHLIVRRRDIIAKYAE